MPTIAEVLIPKLRSNFGDQAFTLRKEAAEVCIVFASPHVDFGDVEIVDDGYEVTIQVGRFTHGHFANYDDRLSTTQAHEAIACDVTRFLRDLFEDRIVLWGSHGGGGGWYSIGHKPASRSLDHGNEFVWSGPRSTSS